MRFVLCTMLPNTMRDTCGIWILQTRCQPKYWKRDRRLYVKLRFELGIAIGRLSAVHVDDVRVREYSQRIRATLQNMDHDVARYGAFLSTYSESGPVEALSDLRATSQRTLASPEAITIAFEHTRGWFESTYGVGPGVLRALDVITAKRQALGLRARLAGGAMVYSCCSSTPSRSHGSAGTQRDCLDSLGCTFSCRGVSALPVARRRATPRSGGRPRRWRAWGAEAIRDLL